MTHGKTNQADEYGIEVTPSAGHSLTIHSMP